MFIAEQCAPPSKPQRGDMCHLSESQIKRMPQIARIIDCGKEIPLLMNGCVESYL